MRWLALLIPLPILALDFQFFAQRVQPIFLKPREGGGRCYDCHSLASNQSRLHLEQTGAKENWSKEQSRRNFETAAKLVTPGEPLKSRLLLHPLAADAAGDDFHTGGKICKSQRDPEWLVLAEWVRGSKAGKPARKPRQ